MILAFCLIVLQITMNVQSFPPLFKSPHVLILGTAPSVKSVENLQYYGHPQNAFWWILSQLYSFDVSLAYQDRVKVITGNGVAVWDVLASCEREGSLDSRIQNEVPNKIDQLLKEHSEIKRIACNGGAAFRLLKKHFPELFQSSYNIVQLPSTSPAHASMSRQEKLQKWSLIKEELL